MCRSAGWSPSGTGVWTRRSWIRRSTGCSWRPTAPISPRCPIAGSATSPRSSGEVAERIAAVRGLEPDELIARTAENAARVFGLHLPRAESQRPVTTVPSDIAIAQAAKLRPIAEVAGEIGLGPDEILPYGRYKAKISAEAIAKRKPKGRLVLVTGINPTPAGEGKSTVTVGVSQALRRLGKKVVVCIREPSLGPVFGVKGGAAGGGYAQVVPMDEINLHFTGDFHAITSAHNLLSAMLDNHLHQGNALGIDPRRITWPRTMDMNDRVAPLDGHQPRRDQRRPGAGGAVRHRAGQRDHGDPGARHRSLRSRGAAGPDHRRPHPRPEAGHRRRPQGVRRHDPAAQGRHPAQPGADPGGRTGAGALRPVRQHRARLQLDRGHQAGTLAGRDRAHRGGLRRRPGRGEILRHQGPLRQPQARGGHRGGDGARAQDERRSEEGRPRQGGRRRAQAGSGEPRGPREERAEVRGPGRSSRSTASPRTPTRS